MKHKTRKLFAAATVIVMAFMLTACNGNKADYSNYPTDIIGIWCEVNGPTTDIGYGENNEEIVAYLFYEFTEDGRMIFHRPSAKGSYYVEETYSITDNKLTIGEEGTCIISVDNDRFTMTTGSGETTYERMSIEEFSHYGIYAIGSELWAEQAHYLGVDGAETTITVGGFYLEEENKNKE